MDDLELDRRIEDKLSGHKTELLNEIGYLLKISAASSNLELSKIFKKLNVELPKCKRNENEKQ